MTRTERAQCAHQALFVENIQRVLSEEADDQDETFQPSDSLQIMYVICSVQITHQKKNHHLS